MTFLKSGGFWGAFVYVEMLNLNISGSRLTDCLLGSNVLDEVLSIADDCVTSWFSFSGFPV